MPWRLMCSKNPKISLHVTLGCLLVGFANLKLKKVGFIWELIQNGQTFNDVEFVFFVVFVSCSMDEAGRLTLRWGNGGRGPLASLSFPQRLVKHDCSAYSAHSLSWKKLYETSCGTAALHCPQSNADHVSAMLDWNEDRWKKRKEKLHQWTPLACKQKMWVQQDEMKATEQCFLEMKLDQGSRRRVNW